MEYNVALLTYDAGIMQTPAEIAQSVADQLNALGAEGWEILSITNLSDMNGPPTCAICKRPISEKDRDDADRPSPAAATADASVSGDRPQELLASGSGPSPKWPAPKRHPSGPAATDWQGEEGKD